VGFLELVVDPGTITVQLQSFLPPALGITTYGNLPAVFFPSNPGTNFVLQTTTNLTTSFNTYGLKWVPGQSITWYLNGNVVGSLTSAQASIPNEPMELIMNLQVAANTTSGWHSLVNSSTPVNNDMLVSDVQVYS